MILVNNMRMKHKKNNIFSGKIIKGSELHAVFQNKNIEILAYNINPSIINEWCEKYYSEDKLREQQEICRKRLFNSRKTNL